MRRILAADIGGTSSRFGFFEQGQDPAGGLRLLALTLLPTAAHGSFAELLQKVFAQPTPFAPKDCDLACLAVAGPVLQGRFCQPPNISWSIDLGDITQAGLTRGVLLNDFAAQAYACSSEAVNSALTIQKGTAEVDGVVAAVGAGTGLGHCALVRGEQGRLLAMPSEAGHCAFAFRGADEQAFEAHLLRATGQAYAYGDLVVSGSGLAHVHAFLTGQHLTPPEVAARLDQHPRTVEWFARFYGRACRHYALAVLALGGVYVAGGVAAKNPPLVTHPAFAAEFRDSRAHHGILASIPIWLNANEESGVYGAAVFAVQLLR